MPEYWQKRTDGENRYNSKHRFASEKSTETVTDRRGS